MGKVQCAALRSSWPVRGQRLLFFCPSILLHLFLQTPNAVNFTCVTRMSLVWSRLRACLNPSVWPAVQGCRTRPVCSASATGEPWERFGCQVSKEQLFKVPPSNTAGYGCQSVGMYGTDAEQKERTRCTPAGLGESARQQAAACPSAPESTLAVLTLQPLG